MDNETNVASPQNDGAGEKLVDEKNGHNSKGIEVKYMTPTSQNGDAKIDIDNLKTAFAGMGKEELMKFASDPFWVRTRWFLFILFWLLWAAMLAGAIAIIVLAPKCAPPTPREWWEQSPLYKVEADSLPNDKGFIEAIMTKLDYLKELGVKSLVLPNILKIESDGDDELKNIANSYGTLDDFQKLISNAKEKDINVILTMVPNHSSLKSSSFNKSVRGEEPYKSFYVWSGPPTSFESDGEASPPNNWKSITGGSAWEWNAERKEFYLHQFDKDQPEYNFHNPQVVQYFNEVMQFWLKLGVKGFFLERTSYLFEDKDLKKEAQKRDFGSATHTEYEFFDHSQTRNLPELVPLLQNWKQLAANSSGILIVDDVSVASNRSIAHLVVKPQTLKINPQNLTKLINDTLQSNPWPVWQISDENTNEMLSHSLTLATLLLPGVPLTRASQHLGPEDLANKTEIESAYKNLVEKRESASIEHGDRELLAFNGTSVFGYTRIKSGNPGFLVVLNTGESETKVNVKALQKVPDELEVIYVSSRSSIYQKKTCDSDSVVLPQYDVAVFSFVPKAKE